MTDDDAAESGRNDASDRMVLEAFSESVAELFGALGMLED